MKQQPSSLTGTRALVTGATSGIGQATALALAARGASVIAVGRDHARCESLRLELAQAGAGHLVVAGNLSDTEFLSALSTQALGFGGGSLDLLVHSAGQHEPAAVEATTAQSFDAAITTNLRAPTLLTAALLPALRAAHGMVVFLNSSIVHYPRGGVAVYAASKAGLRTFADCLRAEVSGHGIRVLSIYPGRTATPMQRERYEAEGLEYRPERLMQPEDVAEAVLAAFASRAEVTELSLRPTNKS
ncbi:MAG: SDR family NAD(P)-dependent oxidoreductase [Pseudomonadota bacterium]